MKLQTPSSSTCRFTMYVGLCRREICPSSVWVGGSAAQLVGMACVCVCARACMVCVCARAGVRVCVCFVCVHVCTNVYVRACVWGGQRTILINGYFETGTCMHGSKECPRSSTYAQTLTPGREDEHERVGGVLQGHPLPAPARAGEQCLHRTVGASGRVG